ncbi:hypothetical protein B4U79_12863 [Dinothrombium tinctorium]|uniref:Glutathione S-transferase omega-1-like protein n=1 Tax=Dinothrombium tinctorium TaxID=1965070 RepID=A0A3S3S721_9ACAR|nr:hypothetical protein B4U79_12863 [Dinothrombium tinctorium]
MGLEMLNDNYKEGSKEPSKKENIPHIYSYQFCPYVERVHLVVAAKEINCETFNIDINSKPEWFFAKNPLGKVPALELDGGKILTESTIIAEYLDEAFEGKRKLQPKDAYEKCKQKIFYENFGSVFSGFYKIYRSKEDLNLLFATIENGLSLLEKELATRGTTFIGGNNDPLMVDYLIWPWLERLPAIISIIKKEKDWQKYLSSNLPLTVKYMQSMLDDSAVKKVAYSDDIHEEYFMFHIRLIRGDNF